MLRFLFSRASLYSHLISSCDSREPRFQLTFVSLRTSALSRDGVSELVSDFHIAMETPLSCLIFIMALSELV